MATTPVWDVSGHALLSPDIDAGQVTELNLLAEDLLDLDTLTPASLTERQQAKAKRAVVLQMNHLVNLPEEIYRRVSDHGVTFEYRDKLSLTSQLALELAQQLLAELAPEDETEEADYRVLRSLT